MARILWQQLLSRKIIHLIDANFGEGVFLTLRNQDYRYKWISLQMLYSMPSGLSDFMEFVLPFVLIKCC